MVIKNRMPALLLISSGLATGNALGAAVTGDLIYKTTGRFTDTVHVSDGFKIDLQGLYQATLTDFQSASAFKSSSLDISDSTDSLGNIKGPGSFTFSAGPGAYNVSMFATVDKAPISEEEKQRLIDENQKQYGQAWARSQTKEQKLANKALWKSWSKEEMKEHQALVRRRAERRVEELLAAMNTGQYGIEISRLEGAAASVSPVPLPAAAWLFGSGMLALAGIGRRKSMRKRHPA